MNFPKDLKYVKSYEWVKTPENDTVLAGISDYAQDALEGLVFVSLSETRDEVTEGKPFAGTESVKAVSDMYSPVSGTVAEINKALLDALESINETPYEAWSTKVRNVAGTAQLMNAAEYKEYVKTPGQGIQIGEGIPSHER